jgi:ribonuclease Y
MSILDNSLFLAGSSLIVGTIIGYWLVRWKERNVRAALAIKEQSILDAAAREAETLAREARVKCNEEIAKVKQETERSFGTRQTQLLEAERRLTERETLINRQLESFVTEEKALRAQQADWQKKARCMTCATRTHQAGRSCPPKQRLPTTGRHAPPSRLLA